MQNSMMLFTFFVFDQKYSLCTFGPKYLNYRFKLKLGTCTNSNMQDSIVMLTFSVFDLKYPFWANLVQKVKIISLS